MSLESLQKAHGVSCAEMVFSTYAYIASMNHHVELENSFRHVVRGQITGHYLNDRIIKNVIEYADGTEK